jgi:large subunit ribosomal protein L35
MTDPWSAPGAFLLLRAERSSPWCTPDWTVTTMPKMKTHKSIRKRFRVTATGKLKRRQAGKKHLLSHKTGKRKRQLRSPITETTKIARTYVRMAGGV